MKRAVSRNSAAIGEYSRRFDPVVEVIPRDETTGIVSHIQHASVSDGPGIRTTVFLSGCPLKCQWCHNPETRGRGGPVLLYYADKCAKCGACIAACGNGAHMFTDAQTGERQTLNPNTIVHNINRKLCSGCGACEQVCPVDAIAMRGVRMGVKKVIDDVMRDEQFYETTRGGITISGGEPLYQFEFTRGLLTAARQEGIHTCLDTTGWGGDAIKLAQYVDMFLWDIKETNEARHLEQTGTELEPILDSLHEVDDAGCKIRIRCPIIPGVNDRAEHMAAIGKLAGSLRNIDKIELIAYHNLGEAKQAAIGLTPVRYRQLSEDDRARLLGELTAATQTDARWHI